MFVSVVWTLQCKIDSGYITLPQERLLAWGADPSVKPRIFPVLINSRSFCREKVKGHTPAGRGQGDRECSFESLMFLLAAASASVMATGQAILRLYCSNIVVHIALCDGPHCLT